MDGTFTTAPALFAQVYSIHAFFVDLQVPCIMALLPEKSAAVYLEFFDMVLAILKDRNLMQLQLTTMRSDYESGLIKALKTHTFFRRFEHVGCFFHYCKAVMDNVKDKGLANAYKQQRSFRDGVRMLLALGLVPAAEDAKANYYIFFNELLNSMIHDADFVGFACLHFEPTWINGYETKVGQIMNRLN